ncbi:MAG: hypothetical protein GEU90_05025 [Gemmatimonas sp.]|nr:hypothetical protein [Gemmatimonas sp.]
MTRVLFRAGTILLALGAIAGCRGPGAQLPADAPMQPIAFYHSVHAGQNEIPCMYCHYNADRSTSAGVPSVQLCVGCHVPGSVVTPPAQATLAFPSAERDSLWNAEALELVGYWQRQEAIPWVRIHNLPAHVQFPHMSHVRVGLQCQTCHGPVEEMEEVYQFSSLQMGWCISCHRGELPLSDTEQTTVRERSSFVRELVTLASEGENLGGFEGTYPDQIASTDCLVCHY